MENLTFKFYDIHNIYRFDYHLGENFVGMITVTNPIVNRDSLLKFRSAVKKLIKKSKCNEKISSAELIIKTPVNGIELKLNIFDGSVQFTYIMKSVDYLAYWRLKYTIGLVPVLQFINDLYFSAEKN